MFSFQRRNCSIRPAEVFSFMRRIQEKYNSGEISKEEYDKWRYNYPAFANLKGYTKVPSKALSDMMIDALKKQS